MASRAIEWTVKIKLPDVKLIPSMMLPTVTRICRCTILVSLLLSIGTAGGAQAAGKQEGQQQASPFVNFGDEDSVDRLKAQLSPLIDAGNFDEAVRVSRDLLKETKRLYGEKHAEYVIAEINHGFLEQQVGNYVEARRLFEAAIALEDKVFSLRDLHRPLAYNNLANLLMFQGDFENARPLLEKTLTMQKQLLGEDDPEVAKTLTNLAVVLDNTGDRAGALVYYQKALATVEMNPATDPSELAVKENNLGFSYQKAGNVLEAKKHYLRALEIREKALGAEHSDVAQTLVNLGTVTAAENLDVAISMLERAVAIYRKSLGNEHPDVVAALNVLARLYWRAGHQDKARQSLLEGAAILNNHIQNVLPALSFAEQRAFLDQQLLEESSLLLSMCSSKDQIDKAYNYLFRWKGLLVEALHWQNNLRKLSSTPELKKTADQLAAVRRQLTNHFYRAGLEEPIAWQKKNEELVAEKEALERKLASGTASGGVSDVLANTSVNQFCALLKPQEALVDIYKYRRENVAGKENEFAYAAIVCLPGKPVQLVDLGSARIIDAAILDWRQHVVVNDPSTAEWQKLRDLVWKPLGAAVPDMCTRLWLNSDSEMARVPWQVFPAEDATPMLLSQLDSDRELAKLRLSPPISISDQPTMLIAGGIDFGRAEMFRGDEVYLFPKLPGTAFEVKQISDLCEDQNLKAAVLTGPDATKRRLLAEFPTSNLVHLATHGYFLDERGKKVNRSPLLESGLVTSKPAEKDAAFGQFLNAEELISADFHQTKLVTLSACETGLGEEATGQGVLGLRAAIMAAGARCIVMSLWKVPDAATLLIMDRFYNNVLQEKMPIAEALRKAQLSVKKEGGNFANPVAWAGWICVGEAW